MRIHHVHAHVRVCTHAHLQATMVRCEYQRQASKGSLDHITAPLRIEAPICAHKVAGIGTHIHAYARLAGLRVYSRHMDVRQLEVKIAFMRR